MSTFSMELKTAMDAKGWPALTLAGEMAARGESVTPITVERWIEGTSEPTVTRAKMIADIMGFSIDSLSTTPEPAQS